MPSACLEQTPELFAEAATTFKALGDPTRLKILYYLYRQPSTVNEVVAHFQITQSAVSQHLRILRHARLVGFERRGTFVTYSVVESKIQQLFENSFYFRQCDNPDCSHIVAVDVGSDANGIFCDDLCKQHSRNLKSNID